MAIPHRNPTSPTVVLLLHPIPQEWFIVRTTQDMHKLLRCRMDIPPIALHRRSHLSTNEQVLTSRNLHPRSSQVHTLELALLSVKEVCCHSMEIKTTHDSPTSLRIAGLFQYHLVIGTPFISSLAVRSAQSHLALSALLRSPCLSSLFFYGLCDGLLSNYSLCMSTLGLDLK